LKYEIACDSNRQKQGARNMPRYLHTFSYSKEAVKGLVSKPENRIEAVRPLIEAAGGKLIDAYYTLGDSDGIIITEFPTDVDALTVSMAVGSTGAIADISTTTLIQIDDAVKAAEKAGMLTGAYRAPGQ
jgi:uncharacterized protein with GYD domain